MTVHDGRPVLLAMNNPLSRDPAHALFPYPALCTGHRLWRMLADFAAELDPPVVVGAHDYLRVFDRRNLLSSRKWLQSDARRAGAELLPQLAGRRVVVLGVSTLAALGLSRLGWGEWGIDYADHKLGQGDLVRLANDDPGSPCPEVPLVRYCCLPHPSGRCREYNDPAMRELTSRTLWELVAQTLSR